MAEDLAANPQDRLARRLWAALITPRFSWMNVLIWALCSCLGFFAGARHFFGF